MDAAQWTPQGIGVVKEVEKRGRPYKEQSLNCPRCNSMNTKFCYYNNYSLSQPRYFCKTCRRYWTEGGSLRNVPVGGGSRKNKRPSFSSSSSSLPNPAPSTTTSYVSSSTIPQVQIPLATSKLYQGLAQHDQLHWFGAGFGFQELMRQSSLKLPLFPFEDLKQGHGGHEEEENGAGQGAGEPGLFWNGGGTW